MIQEKTFKMHIGFWFTIQSNRQSTVVFNYSFNIYNIQSVIIYFKFTYVISYASSTVQIQGEKYQFPTKKQDQLVKTLIISKTQ